MKRFQCAILLLMILLVAATVAVACGGEDATQIPPATGITSTLAPPGTPAQTVTPQATATPITASPLSPEDTVRAFFNAMAAGDSEKMASLAPPEGREDIRQVDLPEVTLSNLTVQKLSETQDTAEVAAGYDVEAPFKPESTDGQGWTT